MELEDQVHHNIFINGMSHGFDKYCQQKAESYRPPRPRHVNTGAEGINTSAYLELSSSTPASAPFTGDIAVWKFYAKAALKALWEFYDHFLEDVGT